MSIATAAAGCRKAFKGVEVGSIVQHCHHEQWLEILEEPAENRIAYILNNKAESERETRLKLSELCGCPWGDVLNIFGEGR